MNARRAFTLIELLVVIAIIIALLAILLPSMNRAITTTQLAICASNQHQIAAAALAYSADNYGKLMSTRSTPWGGLYGRNPEYIGTNPNETNGQWNLHKIQAYTSGFDIPNREPLGVFLCPSVDEAFYKDLSRYHWDANEGTRYITQLSYVYFAGVDRWNVNEPANGAERELVESRPGGSGRVFTSDALMPDGDGQLFRYNHGKRGWAWSYHPNNWAGGVEEYAPPSITGLNQSFGDLSVRWKPAGEIATDKMYNSAAYPYGYVRRFNTVAPLYY